MKKQRLHITLLVFVLLTVFSAPLAVKGIHHHTFEPPRTDKGVILSTYQSPCLVCNYEFVPFTITHQETPAARFFLVCTIQPAIHAIHYAVAFTCFSHRGPPVIY